MDLFVATDEIAVGSDDHGGVVVEPLLLLLCVVGGETADDERRLVGLRKRDRRFLKARVVLEEWRRRFGPDHEIGMRRIGRADYFAVGCTGLRNSGDIGFAL